MLILVIVLDDFSMQCMFVKDFSEPRTFPTDPRIVPLKKIVRISDLKFFFPGISF